MKEEKEEHTNALIHEDSPYLRQHAHNPVNWLPWSEAARKMAAEENKPLLVSIGYSSCHWCHVMEKESFEDEEVAKLMNEYFVCVKVDREERPDVDQIYMEAVQMMTGQGGWPLNCFTNPLGEPIYGGTYFPKEQWMQVLQQLAKLWREDPEKVNDYGKKVRRGMQVTGVLPDPDESVEFSLSVLEDTVSNWKRRFDKRRGGPDKAPKFPLPSNYEFLMNYGRVVGDQAVEEHVLLTLDQMSVGGICDQVGGGFTRYSTDTDWKVPHFEKMLYDNAQLLQLYAAAYGAFGKEEYRFAARGIIRWLRREMNNGSGGYYCALDADSEGEEGKFYTWEESVKEEIDLFAKYYHVDHRGWWEGKLIPVRKGTLEELSEMYDMPIHDVEAELHELNGLLMEKRSQRIRPGTDDKSLCSWNAMLVSGFASAYEFFREEADLKEAKTVLAFLESELLDEANSSLRHTWKDGVAKVDGFLEDYAFMIKAYLDLYGVTFHEEFLHKAKAMAFQTLDRFYDQPGGVFFVTAAQQDDLIARPMELSDNVIPASNSVMAHNLIRLSNYFGLPHMEKTALRLLKGVEKGMVEYGSGYSNWANLWLQKAIGVPELSVTGPEAFSKVNELKGFYPLLTKAAATESSSVEILKGRHDQKLTRLFVCRNHSCLKPVESIREAEDLLENIYTPV